jgi:hypothetical protein
MASGGIEQLWNERSMKKPMLELLEEEQPATAPAQ